MQSMALAIYSFPAQVKILFIKAPSLSTHLKLVNLAQNTKRGIKFRMPNPISKLQVLKKCIVEECLSIHFRSHPPIFIWLNQWKFIRTIENSMFCKTCTITTTPVGKSSGHIPKSRLPSPVTSTFQPNHSVRRTIQPAVISHAHVTSEA